MLGWPLKKIAKPEGMNSLLEAERRRVAQAEVEGTVDEAQWQFEYCEMMEDRRREYRE